MAFGLKYCIINEKGLMNPFLYCADKVVHSKWNLVLGKSIEEIFQEFKGNSNNSTNKIKSTKQYK